ncbi:mechanosensitive ion channel family protein [Paenibacillus pinistramenti]|uniref:mechanosensitive ion channel family protein n=1 Tax=Paenibacillus pinistramenti TaxID=1768003 RepID=UPI0019397585|nr:mechanosensitive ion channel family protein [Paenibacillus pinistramenti]
MNHFLLEVSNAEDTINAVTTWNEKVWNNLTDLTLWENIIFACIRIVIIWLITRLFIRIVYKIIDNSLERKEKNRHTVNPRRFITVGELLKNITTVVCNFIMIMLILGEIGVNLGPLIAGAGIVGLAVGFGAQSLVKDVITGFFVIFEDQFAVGDVVQIAGVKGTVEMIGLRSTRIVSWTGEVQIIPNGMIATVTNYSLNNALALVDLPFSNSKKLDEAIDLLKEAMVQLKEDNDLITEVPNVTGVQSLTTSEYVVRITLECLPTNRADLEREIKAYAKTALEQEEARQAARGEASSGA